MVSEPNPAEQPEISDDENIDKTGESDVEGTRQDQINVKTALAIKELQESHQICKKPPKNSV